MQQMNCRQINEYISAYSDNELEASVSLSIGNHLEHCRNCSEELRRTTEVSALIKKSVISSYKSDSSIQSRAAAINAAVRAKILSDPPVRSEGPPSLEIFIPKAVDAVQSKAVSVKPVTMGIWIKRAALAASFLVAFGLLGIFLGIYWGYRSGPILVGAARTHEACNALMSAIGSKQGDRTQELTAKYAFAAPHFDDAGFKYGGAHMCKTYNAPVVHMLYSKEGRLVSIYYGMEVAAAKLRESEGDIEPGKLYSLQDGTMRVSAFMAPNSRVWIVAGELTYAEMSVVTSGLLKSSFGEHKAMMPTELNRSFLARLQFHNAQ